MKVMARSIAVLIFLLAGASCSVWAQTQDAVQSPEAQGPGGGQRQGRGEGGPRPLIGKITAVHGSTLDLAKPDGTTVTVKIEDKTEFRKDRQSAKLSDFKAGDLVLVRGEENADHTVTAQMIAGRTGGGPNGGPGGGFQGGTLGKDYVIGEVKAIDPPSITVLRPDNVTQTIELNEETSLRKGRESVTMADIQVGDHVFARGASPNNAFVPKAVMVIDPEQWKRMQEFGIGQQSGGARAPKTDAPSQKPTEPNN